jgi:hypothetical protein
MIACALTAYYTFVVTIYYRHDLIDLLNGKQKISVSPFSSPEKNTDEPTDLPLNPEPENQNSKIVQAVTDEIQALISATGKSMPEKSEVLLALHQLLRKYPTVKSSSDKVFIEHFIIAEYATNCSVHLSEVELQSVWV